MTAGTAGYAAHAAALCAGAAVWLVAMREPGARRARVLFVDGPADRWRAWRSWPPLLQARELIVERREWWCVPVAVLLAVLGASVLPLLAGAVAVPLVRRWVRGRARRRQRERAADSVAALCAAVVGELRAGQEPGQALVTGLRECAADGEPRVRGGPGWPGGGAWLGEAEAAVLAAARFGGDVPGALRQAAGGPGLEGLSGMAACWQVAVDGGAGLVAGLDRLETALRADRRRREELRAQLAGAWSTVVVLALLPVAGLGLGAALGADPLRVLLHTPGGLLCLVVGGLLEAAGLFWACRIVRGGEAP